MKRQNELVRNLTGHQLYLQVMLTQLILVVLSIIVGIFLFDSFEAFLLILTIDAQGIVIGAAAGLIIVILDIVLMRVLPERYYDDGGINLKLFSSLTPVKIAWLALCIAISEELFFRGVIQTNSHWIFASLLFAAVHFRYLHHWYLTINIVILSLFIGGLYEWTNSLVVTIICHFIIDFLLGLYIVKLSKTTCEKKG